MINISQIKLKNKVEACTAMSYLHTNEFNIVVFSDKYISSVNFCLLPCSTSRAIAKSVGENSIAAFTSKLRMHKLYLYVISYSKCLAYKMLNDFMLLKPRSTYLNNFGKNGMATQPYE